MIPLWVLLGAAVGAPVRYLTDRVVQARHDSVFPWGTLAVNVVGSFVLGFVVHASAHESPAVIAAVGTGFCGALTTYSTFSWEIVRLVETHSGFYAVAYVIASLLGGFGAVGLGWALASWIA